MGITNIQATQVANDVKEFVHAVIIALYGADSNEAKYFIAHGNCVVIQETCVSKMIEDGEHSGYHAKAGKYAGLNLVHRPYVRQIHIIANCKEGAYLANHLGDNYHYQVTRENLGTFLFDCYKQKYSVQIASLNVCGSHDDAGKLCIPSAKAVGPRPQVRYLQDQDKHADRRVLEGCPTSVEVSHCSSSVVHEEILPFTRFLQAALTEQGQVLRVAPHKYSQPQQEKISRNAKREWGNKKAGE